MLTRCCLLLDRNRSVTTRGIVEFSVFLLQEYHKEMDKGDSQYLLMFFFALFYTAILNAFQSIVLAFITS
jgi:hypothetical protein